MIFFYYRAQITRNTANFFSDQMNRNHVDAILNRYNWTQSKHGGIILHSMSQTREKWDSLVFCRDDSWMIWKSHSILCFPFYFSFRSVIREQLGHNDFRHCHDHLFYGKCHSKSSWSQLCSKVLPEQLRGTLTSALERHLTIGDFTGMDNIGVEPAPIHLTYCCMLLFLSNRPSF